MKTIFELDKEIGESIKKIQPVIEHLQKITPDFIKRDWYLSAAFMDNDELGHLYFENNSGNIEREILKHFQTYITECKLRLRRRFPERKKIITEIFFCYNHKMYSATINLCYSFAEGVIHSNFNQAFWGYNKKKSKSHYENLRDEYDIPGVLKSVYKRLSNRGEINRDTSKDDKTGNIDIGSNNRHLVLHGKSYLYGTKKNAVKAILLLDFINELSRASKNIQPT